MKMTDETKRKSSFMPSQSDGYAITDPNSLLGSSNTSSIEMVTIRSHLSPRISSAVTKRSVKILLWVFRIIPLFAALMAISLLLKMISEPDNWTADVSSTEEEKSRRQTERGTFCSILSAILLNIVGAFMLGIEVPEQLVVTNYGFILGPIINFMLDQAIGTDQGFNIIMSIDGIYHTFGSLISGNFIRYIVTVFLDLFISNPLQDVLKSQADEIGVMTVLQNSDGIFKKYDSFLATNFPSILQSIVGFVTFNAYTNQTRFAWAYPAETMPRELRIPPGSIMLSTAIAGVMYLSFYKMMDYIFKREYFDINTKLIYVMVAIAILYGLNQVQDIEAPIKGHSDSTMGITDLSRCISGMITFAFFVFYGLIYPISTKMRCCCFNFQR